MRLLIELCLLREALDVFLASRAIADIWLVYRFDQATHIVLLIRCFVLYIIAD